MDLKPNKNPGKVIRLFQTFQRADGEHIVAHFLLIRIKLRSSWQK